MPNIIGNLPNSLANGTTADASQVMADLNFIVNQVNANALANTVQTLALQQLTLNEPANGTTTLVVNGAGDSFGANIKLIGNGGVAPNKYLAVVNGVFQITNSARSGAVFTADDSGNATVSGNFTATGTVSGSNITGTSDETLKKDWKPFGPDFLEMVAKVLHGTYTRIDTGERRVGAGAQSLRKVLPEAVFGDDVLSVSEGSAALAIVIELTREVLRLRALLEPTK
ncbi:tail fiber domain-containing protein [Burkholderia ubonensis]|uniref:tail fiber domain-containing protein n=1 Tax=Burkholderia ubonensis TaxID=101571 RepID=UPI000754BBFB|nr:tail fiber domain-containing protein [Burkholderia ubonensis]AOI70839.1 hypothetical protein WI31_15575 [Burkholderia ubonensis]KUZ07384.1 hypothetical protein WI29_34030 [Burkholderia ubonensis]KUZ20625.1 hypothetical protein WI30_01220 [Burkholderia ubonensis]KUZ33381.1 hypothetical protein WI32_19830 [Burkholderia ubonensis]KUZ44800.1 hypothetical protein WI33_28055 [Burkholderia ubonensis]